MFNKHLLKVIIGFCGMITVGLISLVIVDSMKLKNQEEPLVVNTITPSEETPKVAPKPVQKKAVTPPAQKPVNR